jgi:DNA-binding transcriptional regulator YdaS (Cro superfamily)
MNMLTILVKPTLIVGATLAVLAAPQDSLAAREWLWGGGRFLPGAFQHSQPQKPNPIYHHGQIRRYGGRAIEHEESTPLPQRKVARGRYDADLERQQSGESQRAMFDRREIQKKRSDLRKQAELQRRKALLVKRQATLKQERAKLRQQTAARASPTEEAASGTITCDAARAVVADFGFTEVKPELCQGKRLRFGAIRDGNRFSIEVAANGELTKVQRLP